MQAHRGDKGERSHGEILAAVPKETTDRDGAVSEIPAEPWDCRDLGMTLVLECRV